MVELVTTLSKLAPPLRVGVLVASSSTRLSACRDAANLVLADVDRLEAKAALNGHRGEAQFAPAIRRAGGREPTSVVCPARAESRRADPPGRFRHIGVSVAPTVSKARFTDTKVSWPH